MKRHIKYMARFKAETNTPMGIGSGRGGLLNDRLVARDANGLPYIPGTSLAGVIRHELERDGDLQSQVDELFGYQMGQDGQGSRIVFSPGLLVADNNQIVLESLQKVDFEHAYYSRFKHLPERDHVRIGHRGTAEKHGKFEEELVHKGTRFLFEIELEGTDADEPMWEAILNILNHPAFRVGAGTRKGFGQLRILSCVTKKFNLKEKNDLLGYLGKSSSLNSNVDKWKPFQNANTSMANWKHFQIRLTPENFFLFGAGHGNKDADVIPKKEAYFVWGNNGPTLKEHYLIPATSLKGIIAHRVAYHYNRLTGKTIESTRMQSNRIEFDIQAALRAFDLDYAIDDINFSSNSTEWKKIEAQIDSMSIDQSVDWQEFVEQLDEDNDSTELGLRLPVGENNLAIKTLFGYAKTENSGARGKVIFSDLYLEQDKTTSKHFNHVALDRFSGGARDGALFTQEVAAFAHEFTLDIYVESDALVDNRIKESFEEALNDLTTGALQLGGSATKGHGVFAGTWEIKN